MENDFRNDILRQVLSTRKSHIVLQAATGIGKSKIALDKLYQYYKEYDSIIRILIVIPRNVLIQNWKDEFHKWNYDLMLPKVTFTTYVSLPKHADKWDVVIFDEAHHLSERCKEALVSFNIAHCLFLSATLNKGHKEFINKMYGNDIEYIEVTAKKAISEGVLPIPKVVLIPMCLDNINSNLLYCPKKKWKDINCRLVAYKDRWQYKKSKIPYKIRCTQFQYYNEITSLVEFYKRKKFNPAMRNLWLHTAGDRLIFLASQKIHMVEELLRATRYCRSITFCANIEQSEYLGIPCVNHKAGTDNLTKFNNKEIKRIACVGMLDEGLNPVDCQVGIFNMLNSSSRLQIQRIGRILRHQKPVIIIPYFANTRDEEIVNTIRQDYEGMIHEIHNVSELNQYL